MHRERAIARRLIALATLTLLGLARVPAEAICPGIGLTRVDARARVSEDLRSRVRAGGVRGTHLRAVAPARSAEATHRVASRAGATSSLPSTTHRPGPPSRSAFEGRPSNGRTTTGTSDSVPAHEESPPEAWRAGRFPATARRAHVAAPATAFYDAHAPPPSLSVAAGRLS